MNSNQRRPRVLICDRIADSGIELLAEHADVDVQTGLKPEELLKVVGDYQAVVVRSATKITASIIERAYSLKVIGRAGSGLDNIDVEAAKQRNIKVVNCPDANTRAVAEHTLALMLALARHLPEADAGLKEGRWEKNKLMGTGLYGKTLGIIGFGRIGREVAIRAQAFGMQVLVNQRRPTPELNLEAKVDTVDLNDLLRRSDFVTLHVPARSDTENLIAAAQLALMKPTAYLLNTARGTVVNETDLLEALNRGQLAGAALDVFAQEPATHNALAQHPRVIATPHVAASTEDAQVLAAEMVAKQIIDVLEAVPVDNPLALRVVPTERVVPHENTDPRRVARLVKRLSEDGILANPPVVAEFEDKYVVLDGATRVKALKELGVPQLVVQVVSPQAADLELGTWFHAVRELEPGELLTLLAGVAEISLRQSDRQRILNEMVEYGGLCYLHTIDDEVYLIAPAPGVNHLQALNKLTQAYIEASHVTRTLEGRLDYLRTEFPDMAALVIFPEYTVEQVLQITRAGHVVPAGITRFIIPDRVLRINLPLDFLRSDQSLLEKNTWLRRFVLDKLGTSEARYYAEPVYLMDE
ncbi:MAG TPA: NAD(P)-dependent oxidoreductase [Anaerolineae bacterium]|nr:NAD(P)-dependent oxidoreductase [Anaerolineae bacterium]